MQDGLVGAWEFVNMLLRDPEGRELELFEDAGTGLIVFAAEGQVSVQLRVTDSVNVYLKGDLFTTYYGPYRVNDDVMTVRVTDSSSPRFRGREVSRLVSLDGDRLVLGALYPDGRRMDIAWRRVSAR